MPQSTVRIYGEECAGQGFRGLDPEAQAGEGLLSGAVQRGVPDRQIVLGMIERGEVNVTLAMIAKMADALGLMLSGLFLKLEQHSDAE